jgi:hypothetical protein
LPACHGAMMLFGIPWLFAVTGHYCLQGYIAT